ncbi:alpha-(1-_3)-arabinofuranosyltransferase family protein [Gordonia sp. (in: high G+C Gram-positive bacteria)]|uniref:alpha-(1->3)-arabinofuranosyltransferase domain-containing protein n=1 Tax=Gordonia sp. (in: high G+C Gram-positive bacteria) TaxID=84139 RepID=UPI0039E2A9DD
MDLTANPWGFLSRAAHLWSPTAPLGQVQNQAYGYFFPHGAFFALGDLLRIPPWITQRLWWAVLLAVGVIGIVKLAQALTIGSPGSRLLAGAVFALSPRVLTTIGSISSETLPMMLAPWVVLGVVTGLTATGVPLWRLGLRAAIPIALMGAVNAVATGAAAGVGVMWWLLAAGDTDRRRWARFGAWWALGTAAVCAWWLIPLLLLSRVSPPFLDFIESSRVTTQWSSLTEVLRGTSAWTPFVSPERVAGAILVTQPAAVLATGVLAAAGLAGLTMGALPYRRRLVAILGVGLLLMCLGYVGGWGSPIAEPVRTFLDGAGAPLRNLHKFDPFLRLPLVLGIAHLVARVPLPPAVTFRRALSAFAHPQRSRPIATTIVLLVALLGAGTLAWTGGLAGDATYRSLPQHWRDTAAWLDRQHDDAHPSRALVVPGSPFAQQLWGTTRDEPMQALATAPWAVRDAIPLVPPTAIRALDAVQRDVAQGNGSPLLAPMLAQMGVRYVVLRADLDPRESRSARPLLAQQALTSSPGLHKVAQFGDPVAPAVVRGVVVDDGLRPPLPAIQIFAVDDRLFPGTGPVLADVEALPQVVGGPEGVPPGRLALLQADARRAGLPPTALWVTDTPTDRETDFGRVDDNRSAIRSPDDPRRTKNAVDDYPAGADTPRVVGQWLLDNEPGAVRVSASSSASDATQPGQTAPAQSTAAAFDDDTSTSWLSAGLDRAVGQWLALDFTRPRTNLAVTLTTAKALGPDVTSVLITTDDGTAVAQGVKPGEPITVTLPPGPTRRVQLRATGTKDGTVGTQFALAEVALTDLSTGQPLRIRHRVVLPPLPAGATVAGWSLRQEQTGRGDCLADRDRVRCSPGLGLAPETVGAFSRVLSVPTPGPVDATVTLRPRTGDEIDRLLQQPAVVTALGDASVADPRGSAAAAVDGDPATTWTAPEASADTTAPPPRGAKRRKPAKDAKQARLTLHLPAPQRVEKLVLGKPAGYPAAPVEVAVDLGTGEQIRRVGPDGTVALDPAVTDRIVLTVRRASDLINVNNLGFARPAPVGITDIRIVPDAPMAVRTDRPVHLGCDAGLSVSVSGQVVPLRVDTTTGALRSGTPVTAVPCGPVQLGGGEQELTVNPGKGFSVDAVELRDRRWSSEFERSENLYQDPATTRWDATTRQVTISPHPKEQVLVVPESANPGWRARLNGTDLRALTVDGWQQGWIVPANTVGTVELTYPLDRPYRWALGVGLAVMALVLALAAFGPRSTAVECRRGTGRRWSGAHVATATTTLAASWLLAGWPGLVLSAAVGAAMYRWSSQDRYRGAPVVVAFTLFFAATCGLAAGPWKSPTGYHGYDWWVQGLALAAVAVTVWRSVLDRGPGEPPTVAPDPR